MYLKKHEEEFLIELEEELFKRGMIAEYARLWFINERIKKEREKFNEKTWNYIKEKRKVNPNYGR